MMQRMFGGVVVLGAFALLGVAQAGQELGPVLLVSNVAREGQPAEAPAAGAKLFVGKDDAVLRAGPGPDSKLLTKLPVGLPVTVQPEAAVPGEVSGAAGHWVRVYSNADGAGHGWMWSGALTPARFRFDMDEDGEAEVMTVTFNKDNEVIVWLREPSPIDAEHETLKLNLGSHNDMGGVQDRLELQLLTAAEAGIPLLRVQWLGAEMCGGTSRYAYASYRSKSGEARLQKALEHNGSGADAPIWWETEARFSPADKAVTVVESHGEEVEEGAGPGTKGSTEHRFLLRSGVFLSEADAANKPEGGKPEGGKAGGGKAEGAKAEGGKGGGAKDKAAAAAKEKAAGAGKKKLEEAKKK